MSTNDMSRRGFLTAAAGTAAAGAAAGTAAAQQEIPDYGPYLADANLFDDNVADNRDSDEVTVAVGAGPNGVSFDPPTIWVSPGTTIIWEWTGEGGGHNVVPEEGPAGFEHEEITSEEGYTYEYEVTEEDAGITTYKCIPHEGQGMKGGVAVGDDIETVSVGGGGGGPPVEIPNQALSLTMATFIAMTTTLGLGYFFMKFGGDYETQ